MATNPPLPSSPAMQTGGCIPGLLARFSDFVVNSITFGINETKRIAERNPRRVGVVVQVDPAQSAGIAVLPMWFNAATGAILPKQVGIVYLTCDLWKSATLADWYAFATQAGTLTVIDLYNTH